MKVSIFVLMCLGFVLTDHANAQQMYRWVDAKGVPHYSDLPPPPSVSQVEKRTVHEHVVDNTPGYELRKAMESYPVSLYTAQTCGEPCDLGRDLLTKRGVPFTEHQVRTRSEQDAYREKFKGADKIPGLEVGKQTQIGFEEGAWTSLLNNAGYPKKAAKLPVTPPPTTPPASKAL